MNGPSEAGRTEELLRWVEDQKQLDRRVRRVGYAAWAGTVFAVVVYGISVLANIVALVSALAEQGVTGTRALPLVLDTLTPLVVVLGALSLLVAVLSTIAMFLRFRTASLAEIQSRLAAIEGMLLGDGSGS